MTRYVDVVTYEHADVGGRTSVCGDCEDDLPEWMPTLGSVYHGAHDGECDICSGASAAQWDDEVAS